MEIPLETFKNVSDQFQAYCQDKINHINPNVKDWPLMSSTQPTIYMTLVYLLLVKLLPFFMKYIGAFHLKFVIFCYNVFSICLNVYIGINIIYLKYKASDFYLCTTIQSKGDPFSLQMNKILWLFYVSKGLELFDTIFFILRKKFYKISNLHIFNHASMFPIWWLVVAFFANGTSGYVALINSILHVIMQYYYIMSTVGPSYQKWIWWKKYIVQMQMLQYCIVIVFCSLLLHKNCDYSNDRMIWFVIYYSLTHVALIYQFYTKSYYNIMAKKLDEERTSVSVCSTPSSIASSLKIRLFGSQSAPAAVDSIYKSPISRRRALNTYRS